MYHHVNESWVEGTRASNNSFEQEEWRKIFSMGFQSLISDRSIYARDRSNINDPRVIPEEVK